MTFKENSATACSTFYLAKHWRCVYKRTFSPWTAISLCSHNCSGPFRRTSDFLWPIFFFYKNVLSLRQGMNSSSMCRRRQTALSAPLLTVKVEGIASGDLYLTYCSPDGVPYMSTRLGGLMILFFNPTIGKPFTYINNLIERKKSNLKFNATQKRPWTLLAKASLIVILCVFLCFCIRVLK